MLYVVCEWFQPNEESAHRPVLANSPEDAAVYYCRYHYAIAEKHNVVLKVRQYDFHPNHPGPMDVKAGYLVEVANPKGDWSEVVHVEPAE